MTFAVWLLTLFAAWFLAALILAPIAGRLLAWRRRSTRHGIPHPAANFRARRTFRRQDRNRHRQAQHAARCHADRTARWHALRRRMALAGHDPDLAGPAPELMPVTTALTLPTRIEETT